MLTAFLLKSALRRNAPAAVRLATTIGGLCLFTGCYHDNIEELYPAAPGATCDTVDVAYTAVVQPIVAQNCAFSGCHAGSPAAAGINLETYSGLQAIAANGDLVGVITHASGYSPMPKNASKLPDCSIAQIRSWVASGAPEN